MDTIHNSAGETPSGPAIRWLKSAIQQLSEGVLVVNEDKEILIANPAAMAVASVLTDTVSASSCSADEVDVVRNLLVGHTADSPQVAEIVGPKGRAFEIRTFPVSLESEKRHWVALLRELTQDRKQRRLLEQQDRLAAIGQLAAGISHDFNNLLTGILGYAELLTCRRDMPCEAHNDADAIKRLGREAAQLVRQILDFSAQAESRRGTVDLAASLQNLHKLLIRILPENIRLHLDIHPGVYPVAANPVQFQQIITNLAVNARDAMPEGGTLDFQLRHQKLEPGSSRPLHRMADGEWVVLRVSDSGTGMHPKVLKRIFEPFYTTKEAGAGTGLGLSQVYGIIKQQDGYIFAESEPFAGSAFTIWLRDHGHLETNQSPEDATTPIQRGNGETILVVEDEREVLEVIEQMLTYLGFRVITTSNGEEALSLCETHHTEIALVLTDMIMPQMAGADLFHAIRARYADMKIVVLSGYPKEQVPDSDAVTGVDGWLTKPPDLAGMGSLLHTLIQAD